jgi:hypothetical protein
LAVQDTSIVSEPDAGQESKRPETRARDQLVVTLMVDTRQAEALQLAMENGSISLAMRNPLDKRPVDMDATILSEGRLARLGSILPPSVVAARLQDDPNAQGLGEMLDMVGVTPGEGSEGAGLPSGFLSDYRRRSPQWRVTVIRGREVEEEVLEAEKE